MIAGQWKPCVIDVDRSTEFTGDDVDQYSELVDLEGDFEFLTVIVPTIENATITPYIQKDKAVDNVPVPVHFFHDNDADTDVIQSTVAGAGGIAITFNIGGVQFVRLKVSATQAEDRTFYVRGFNRG